MSIKVTPVSTEAAIRAIVYPTPGARVDVMAANYDSDCQNLDDHDADGTCQCWDGLTLDDVDAVTDPVTLMVDVNEFALWGPFALWTEVAD